MNDMNKKCIFHSHTVQYLRTMEIWISLINSYLAFCFLLFFSVITILQLGVSAHELPEVDQILTGLCSKRGSFMSSRISTCS